MKFLVITLAPTLKKGDSYHSYAPYVREMDIWFSKVSEVTIISPSRYSKKLLTTAFFRKDIRLRSISELNFKSIRSILVSIFSIPISIVVMIQEMRKADHIHLRCPANIALLGCLVQVLFPKKRKTVKYAGNWDPNARQPLSYRFQKWILANTILTKNMQVLVYGDWPGKSKNIKPFFTATYPQSKIENSKPRTFLAPYRFIFVGSLSSGKRPMYAVKLVEMLGKQKVACFLDLYGDGDERLALERYIESNNLGKKITLHGNQTSEIVETAYKESHFSILPSKSEGWPKAVAEAMFWGSIPIVTRISCIPWMLGNGERGIFLQMNLDRDVEHISAILSKQEKMNDLSLNAQRWSQKYTLDSFEAEIAKLLTR